MIVDLYVNSSSENTLNKKLSDTYLRYEGSARGPFDIINPVIDIDTSAIPTGQESAVSGISIISTYNYVSVSYGTTSDRYYFIRNAVMITDTILRLTLHEDVLRTYRGQILNAIPELYISRTTTGYDPSIHDDERPLSYVRKSKRSAITMTSSATIQPFVRSNDTSYSDRLYRYAWIYATDNASDIALLSESAQVYSYPTVLANALGTTTAVDPMHGSVGGVVLDNPYFAISQCQKSTEVANATISLVCYPFIIGTSDSASSVSVVHPYGKELGIPSGGLTSASSFISSSDVRLIADFSMDYESFITDLSDYGTESQWIYQDCDYELYLPFYGYYRIQPSYFADGVRIRVYAVINLAMNTGMYVIVNGRTGYYDTLECQFGTEIPITHTNATDIRDRRVSNGIRTTVGLVGSMIEVGIGASTGHPWMVGTGIASGVSTIGSSIATAATTHDSGSAHMPASTMGDCLSYTPYMQVTYPVPVFESSTANVGSNPSPFALYVANRGLPMQSYYADSWPNHGFVQVSDFGQMTQIGLDSENEEIRSLLRSGIYMDDQR